MSGNIRNAVLLVVSLMVSIAAQAADDPSIHQIYAAAEAGQFAEAQRMMDQVLKDHPESGKAHFVEAELLAKQGRFAQASEELQRAEARAPGLPFAKPESVQHLKQLLVRSNMGAVSYAAPSASAQGISWTGILLGGGVIALLIFGLRRLFSRPAVPSAYASPANGSTYGNAPMGQMPPASGGLGSSIVGGLATGAAVGAGMVAGEAIAHHFLDGDEQRRRADAGDVLPNRDDGLANDDMGGDDFGISYNSSWDDSSFGGGDDGDW